MRPCSHPWARAWELQPPDHDYRKPIALLPRVMCLNERFPMGEFGAKHDATGEEGPGGTGSIVVLLMVAFFAVVRGCELRPRVAAVSRGCGLRLCCGCEL